MKEKREIILFFTRLLMLAVMLAVLFGVIFGMTSAKNQNMCRRSALILQAGTEIFRPRCRGIPKRGDIVYRAYCGERER